MKRIIGTSLLTIVLISHAWSGATPTDSLLNVDKIGPQSEKIDESIYQQILYVSMTTGSDTTGDGSEDNPWQTVISASGIYDQGTIYMQEWIDLYGGFNPETWERDLVKNRSILDGRGLRRVVVGRSNSRIDGFVITNGLSRSHGAGILCDDTSPTITNNYIINNLVLDPESFNRDRIHQEGYHGGGIACLFNSVPSIKNNLIYGNRTSVGTGAGIAFYGWVRLEGAPATRVEDNILTDGWKACVENNVIIGNISGVNDFSRTRSSSGGGIACAHEARPIIRNNVVIGNEARGRSDAGGIYSEYYSYPTIEGNWILGNISDDDGGGFYTMKLGHPVLLNNIIAGNWTRGGGVGGIRLSKEGRATIRENLIIYNPGGGLQCVDSYLELEDNIILYNSGGSGLTYVNNFSYMKPIIIKNNIIRDNEEKAIRIVKNAGSTPIVEDNNVDDDWVDKGENNINRIPIFRKNGKIGKAKEILFDPEKFLTFITLDESSKKYSGLEGRVVRIGNDWGVIKDQQENIIRIWGLLESAGKELVEFEILPSYSN